MSAALAAGVAALIRSRFPGLTAAAVVQANPRSGGSPATRQPARPWRPGRGGRADRGRHPRRAAGPPATATPSPVPSVTQAPRMRATSTAARSGAGILAGSLLRDAVIVLAVLIAALAAALLLHSSRRRRAAATARQPRAIGQGGTHARRPRAAPPGRAGRRPAATSKIPWGRPRPPGSAPRLAPPPPPGSLGIPNPARRARRGATGEPPWNPPGRRGPRRRRGPLTSCCRRGSWRQAWPRRRFRRSFPSCRRRIRARCTCGTRRRPARCPSSARTRRRKISYSERARGSSPGPPSSAESLAFTSDAYWWTYSSSGELAYRAHHVVGDGAPRPARRLARQVTNSIRLPILTSMRVGLGSGEPGGSIFLVPIIATGITGAPEFSAR